MIIPDKTKEFDNIFIDFNEYLQSIPEGLEQLDKGVRVIFDNIRVEIEELFKGTKEIILAMKSLEQGRTVVVEC